jgi:peptidoglycan/LPS O-acetylase OafA/YrhL
MPQLSTAKWKSPLGDQPARPAKKELTALTGLRFFAAFGVVLYHFMRPAVTNWPAPLRNMVGSGFTAVSLFFLLSGFVLSYTYLGPKGEMRGTKRLFYSSRIARIYPAYFLAFLLATPTNILWSLRVNSLSHALIKLGGGAAIVLSLQQAWTPWTAWYWNFPAWSISVEAFFYLVFPFVAQRLYLLRPSLCVVTAVGLWIVSLLPPLALYLTTGITGPPETGQYLPMAVEFTPLLRLPDFLIGILLGRLFVSGPVLSEKASRAGSYLALAGILLVFAYSSSIPHAFLSNGLMIPLFAMLIFSLAQGAGWLARLLSLPVIVLLGEASYGVYILQIPISYALHMPPPYTSFRLFAIYAVVLLLASMLSWRFIESPLRTRIRGWLASS